MKKGCVLLDEPRHFCRNGTSRPWIDIFCNRSFLYFLQTRLIGWFLLKVWYQISHLMNLTSRFENFLCKNKRKITNLIHCFKTSWRLDIRFYTFASYHSLLHGILNSFTMCSKTWRQLATRATTIFFCYN